MKETMANLLKKAQTSLDYIKTTTTISNLDGSNYYDGIRWIYNNDGTTKVFLFENNGFSVEWKKVKFDKTMTIKDICKDFYLLSYFREGRIDKIKEDLENFQKHFDKIPIQLKTEQEILDWFKENKLKLNRLHNGFFIEESPIYFYRASVVLPQLKFQCVELDKFKDFKLKLLINSFLSSLPKKHQECLIDYLTHYPVHKIGDFSATTDISLFKEKYSSYLIFPHATKKERKFPLYAWCVHMASEKTKVAKQYILNNFLTKDGFSFFHSELEDRLEEHISTTLKQNHDHKKIFYFYRALFSGDGELIGDILDEPYQLFSRFDINKHTTIKSLLRYVDIINTERAEEKMKELDQPLKSRKQHITTSNDMIAYIPKTTKEIWLESQQLKHCLYANYRELILKNKYSVVLIRTFSKEKFPMVLKALKNGNSSLFFQEAKEKSTLGIKINLFGKCHVEQHRGNRNSTPPKKHKDWQEIVLKELFS